MTAPRPGERCAALDVGSNSIRLIVADWDPERGFTPVDELKEQPRLAQGVGQTGRLDPVRLDAAYAALARMREMVTRRGVSRFAAVATAAVREASNGAEFAERVRTELGIPLEVIGPEREAQLSWRSVAHHVPMDHGRTLVADIGGGSLELIAAVDGLVEHTVSLPLGAVRLSEQQHRDTIALKALRKQVRHSFRKALPWRDWQRATLIGLGGTFTSLARIISRQRGDDASAIHRLRVTTAEVERLLEWLARRPVAERATVPGLNPARADIIVAGLAVVAELLDRIDAQELTVSTFGLRDGLLLELAGSPPPAASSDNRLRPIREMLERCHGDRRHAEQVRHLALSLWQGVAEPLGAAPEEQHMLEAAALLHDVGHLMAYRRHQHHSYQLIMHADRLGLSPRERRLVALAARYHRKATPRPRHAAFADLTSADQRVVQRLAAVLRVADGLDRGHTAAVDQLHIALDPDRCTIAIAPRLHGADLGLEIWGGSRKTALLAKLLGRDVTIIAPDHAP